MPGVPASARVAAPTATRRVVPRTRGLTASSTTASTRAKSSSVTPTAAARDWVPKPTIIMPLCATMA